EHGPLERLEDNLWRVEGALPNMALRRVMTVVRMADGRLVIHSAIALPDELMAQIEAWGRPSYLLVPNAYHRLDAPAYKARYDRNTGPWSAWRTTSGVWRERCRTWRCGA